MPEEIKIGAGPTTPASEKKPESGNPLEDANQKAELESLKKSISEKDERIKQAEYNIEMLKKRLKDAGVEDEEGNPEIAELKTSMGVLKEELSKMREDLNNKLTEFGRTLTAKANASPGGGPGQTPPSPEKGEEEPALSPEDQKILRQGGFKWDPKRKGYVSPTGRFRAWDDKTGLVAAPTP